ncbi:heavy metal translocating P-type ATPase [Xylophilus sp.]|uniref:heavy metal translocating P-type ATPase n=1 Tax=Xylophilus sp. TaxID=2653893 RepID=UPI0013B92328|nr:heavy metal translocating P-type ATPase [Xylophilus sp.]KAF1049107.1 MAG: Cadmium-transporting ATPase [Xylophilus sp.]
MSRHCGSCRQPSPPRAHAHAHDHGADHHDHGHGHAPGDGHVAHAGHDHAHLPGWTRIGFSLALAAAAELLHAFGPQQRVWETAGMAVALAAIGLAGLGVYRSGLRSLLRGRLGIDALMAVAVTGAFAIGQWPEAAMVMALYALAERIEDRAADRAHGAIAGLLALAPDTAEVCDEATGGWAARPAADVPAGATVRIRPGARVPLDGVVTAGRSALDQSAVTGESLPVDKAPGDALFAGTVNADGELSMRVTAAAADSTLARVIRAVDEAQAARAPAQRLVDRFAAVYTPVVFTLACATAAGLPLVLGWDWSKAIYRALVLLVIACPCALVISTPVTVVSALAAAARRGILVKGGAPLEAARGLRAVALDKTGTVTAGQPALVEWRAWDGADAAWAARAAASLAARSDHPVSQAIAAGFDAAAAAEVQDFRALPGRGTEGRLDGRLAALGNRRLLAGPADAPLEAALAAHEQAGRTVTLLVADGTVHALFAVADTMRPEAVDAVAQLQALGIAPVLLSGDNAATVATVARAAGIENARGNLLPADKLAIVKELQRRHGAVAMAGDGINDAPALARADIGFAMGAAGTDVAMETAGVVVMNDDLRRIAETVRLSRRTHALLWQNIALALGIKAVVFALAVAGHASMWMAVFADMGASLLVIANGLRLLHWRGT